MASENKPEYRFEFRIVDANLGHAIVSGNTFLSSHIGPNGENENVDMEVASAMRNFNRVARDFYEKQNYSEGNEEE